MKAGKGNKMNNKMVKLQTKPFMFFTNLEDTHSTHITHITTHNNIDLDSKTTQDLHEEGDIATAAIDSFLDITESSEQDNNDLVIMLLNLASRTIMT